MNKYAVATKLHIINMKAERLNRKLAKLNLIMEVLRNVLRETHLTKNLISNKRSKQHV